MSVILPLASTAGTRQEAALPRVNKGNQRAIFDDLILTLGSKLAAPDVAVACEAAQKLAFAILRNREAQTEAIASGAPELLDRLLDPSQTTVDALLAASRAAVFLVHHGRDDVHIKAQDAMGRVGAVERLVGFVSGDAGVLPEDAMVACCTALGVICVSHAINQSVAHRQGAVGALVHLVAFSRYDQVRHRACFALICLAASNAPLRSYIISSGGLRAIASLLDQTENEEHLIHAMASVRAFTLGHLEGQLDALAAGVHDDCLSRMSLGGLPVLLKQLGDPTIAASAFREISLLAQVASAACETLTSIIQGRAKSQNRLRREEGIQGLVAVLPRAIQMIDAGRGRGAKQGQEKAVRDAEELCACACRSIDFLATGDAECQSAVIAADGLRWLMQLADLRKQPLHVGNAAFGAIAALTPVGNARNQALVLELGGERLMLNAINNKGPDEEDEMSTLGLKWKEVGTMRPTRGTKVNNNALRDALKAKVDLMCDKFEFSRAEFDAFDVVDLHDSNGFVRVRDSYFQPAVVDEWEESIGGSVYRCLASFAQDRDDIRPHLVDALVGASSKKRQEMEGQEEQPLRDKGAEAIRKLLMTLRTHGNQLPTTDWLGRSTARRSDSGEMVDDISSDETLGVDGRAAKEAVISEATMINVLVDNGWADTMAVRAPLSAHELLPLLRMLPVEGETAHAAVACLVQLLRRQVATPSEMLIALELHDAQGLNDLIRLLSGPDDPIEDGEQAHEQEPAAQLIQAAMGLVASLVSAPGAIAALREAGVVKAILGEVRTTGAALGSAASLTALATLAALMTYDTACQDAARKYKLMPALVKLLRDAEAPQAKIYALSALTAFVAQNHTNRDLVRASGAVKLVVSLVSPRAAAGVADRAVLTLLHMAAGAERDMAPGRFNQHSIRMEGGLTALVAYEAELAKAPEKLAKLLEKGGSRREAKAALRRRLEEVPQVHALVDRALFEVCFNNPRNSELVSELRRAAAAGRLDFERPEKWAQFDERELLRRQDEDKDKGIDDRAVRVDVLHIEDEVEWTQVVVVK